MNTKSLKSGVLIAGAIFFTLNAGLYLAIILGDTIQRIQTWRDWIRLDRPFDLLHVPLTFLVIAVILAFPMGIWLRIIRHYAAAKCLSATPPSHGKYLPWGRNLRRHASIPARYSGVRPRKPFRPMRDEKSLP